MTRNLGLEAPLDTAPKGPDAAQFTRPGSVVDELVDFIRNEIATGTLKSGRLRINRLAERFGVSAVPVREALRRLQAEGLIIFDQNREVRIVELSHAEVREVFLMRSLLEPLLLRDAIPHLPSQVQEWSVILEAYEGMNKVELGSSAWLEFNARFHQTMYLVADMPTVLRTVQGLWTGVNSVLVAYGQSKDAVLVAQREHGEMIELIRQGDADAAAELLRRHLNSTYEECRRLMTDGRNDLEATRERQQ